VIVRRDDLGRFVRKAVPRRDDLGRFAKKGTSKKVEPRKAAPKKDAPKKAAPKKTEPKKAAPKKAAPKKAEPKKSAAKKAAPKKTEPKKTEPKKAAPKKAKPKKSAAKKAAPKRGKPRKAEPKKSAAKKAAPKKTEPKKAAPKKAAPKKAEPKKSAAKKAAPKRGKPRKVSPRKRIKPRKARRRRRRVLPEISARAREAEAVILEKLAGLMEVVGDVVEGSDVAVKSFVNADGSVDGELKVSELPDDFRTEEGAAELTAILSEVFRAFRPFPTNPSMGGKFWVSFAMRFGPQNESEIGKLAELYKKFRGLFQVGTYPAAAWHPTPIQLALTTGLKTIVEGVMRRQGFPPSVVLVRFTWTPDGRRPGHLAGEAGGGR
jgi:hypothetical protein